MKHTCADNPDLHCEACDFHVCSDRPHVVCAACELIPEQPASREEQQSRYIDCGPAAWDDR
jgi:hypothetical protein